MYTPLVHSDVDRHVDYIMVRLHLNPGGRPTCFRDILWKEQNLKSLSFQNLPLCWLFPHVLYFLL